MAWKRLKRQEEEKFHGTPCCILLQQNTLSQPVLNFLSINGAATLSTRILPVSVFVKNEIVSG